MNRFASTRSEVLDSHPWPGRAQWSVGSIEDDGIRYGFTTHCLIASTIAIAPAMVTIQSIAIRHGRGRRCVIRSTGLRDRFCAGAGAATVARGGGGGGAGCRPAAPPRPPTPPSAGPKATPDPLLLPSRVLPGPGSGSA